MTYGEFLYGTRIFSDDAGSDQPEIATPDLMQYLPPYYSREKGEMLAIQRANAEELGKLRYAVDDLLRQFFVMTATWGLDLWEQELGLTTDRSKSYERRREIILAKLRGAGTTTKEMIKNVATAFSGGEVAVIEYPEEYRFVVQFIGIKGIPPNMAGFIAMLEDIKPAHLVCEFKYTYTVWNMLGELTWNQAEQKTWNELKTYEGA